MPIRSGLRRDPLTPDEALRIWELLSGIADDWWDAHENLILVAIGAHAVSEPPIDDDSDVPS
jgi:hypothetical protein